MEDIFKFIVLAGFILIGIFREVSKNSRTENESDRRPARRTPPMQDDTFPETTPLPENWPQPWDKEFEPRPARPSARTTAKQQPDHPTRKQQKKKKKEEISVAASIAQSVAQDRLHNRQEPDGNAPADSNDDFTIRSAEEARRAIIWGEILQRKY